MLSVPQAVQLIRKKQKLRAPLRKLMAIAHEGGGGIKEQLSDFFQGKYQIWDKDTKTEFQELWPLAEGLIYLLSKKLVS